jgi:hypothetical protein
MTMEIKRSGSEASRKGPADWQKPPLIAIGKPIQSSLRARGLIIRRLFNFAEVRLSGGGRISLHENRWGS